MLTVSANRKIQNLCKELCEVTVDTESRPHKMAKKNATSIIAPAAGLETVHVNLVLYQFRGGGPQFRGFHRQGAVSVLELQPTMRLKDVKALVGRNYQQLLMSPPGGILPPSPFEEHNLVELPVEGTVESCLSEGWYLVALIPMPMGFDIGVFEETVAPGTGFLGGGPAQPDPTPASIQELIAASGASPEALFRQLAPFVPAKACHALIKHLDEVYRAEHQEDLKQTLTREELGELIGLELVDSLIAEFGGCDRIRLRRCEAYGKRINLHTDVHRRTMQVPLNGADTYEGGDLVYVTKEGLKWPSRPAGSATIHDSTILHGVSELRSGIRYSLFLQEVCK